MPTDLSAETLRDLLLEETKFLRGVSSEVKALEAQLKEMQCLLEDVDRRQHEGKTVKNWISQIRNLAYRSEDLLETYAAKVSSRRGRGFKKILRRFSCAFNEGFTLHQIGSEISDIKSQIARVTQSMKDYGMKSIIQGESSATAEENRRSKRQTYSFETDDCFVGKEDDLKRLVSLIVDNKEHRVISLWGMGGIGKTTIARKVYNHVETKRYFESFAWVCITQQCQIRSVFEEVFRQLMPEKREETVHLTTGQLIEQLRKIQKNKRCIIVVDDLWEIDHWEGLQNAFLVAGQNSKILLTTRKENIANVGFSYELGLLNGDEGLELLKKKAFPQNNFPDFVEERWLQKMGNEMVKKCGYLPLVISLLGGILRSKTSLTGWELVNKNIDAYLYRGEGVEEVHKVDGVLDLSYEDLPSYLKSCFLYMGCFREDESIWADDIYRLWIAQGMVSNENQEREETLMDAAEFYLSELASRSLVRVEVDNALPGRRYGTCELHDVVRELCLSKVKKEDFRLKVIDYQGDNFNILNLSGETRHLSIHFRGGEGDELKTHSAIIATQEEIYLHLRSLKLLYSGGTMEMEFQKNAINFEKLKLLRSLVFEEVSFEGRQLPKEICNLIHLRHLGLRSCELDEIPSSICHLTYLYTLDFEGSCDVRVPNVMTKLTRLRHLVFPFYDKEKVGNYQLRLEDLNELETLEGLNSLVHDLKYVTKMKNLRLLSATVHDNESLSFIIDVINTKWHDRCYYYLVIAEGCEFTSSEEGPLILNKVFTCSNLNALVLFVPMRKLPEECRTQLIFPTLVALYLGQCEMEDDPMEILEKLPCLEKLAICKGSYVGEEMICHSMGFPQLIILELKGLPNLREWRVEERAMPILSTLEINDCPQLEMIPDGLRFITTLQKLEIKRMPELGKRVSASGDDGGQEGEDFDKVRHVRSIIIRDY